jgi:hypothetical protein
LLQTVDAREHAESLDRESADALAYSTPWDVE